MSEFRAAFLAMSAMLGENDSSAFLAPAAPSPLESALCDPRRERRVRALAQVTASIAIAMQDKALGWRW